MILWMKTEEMALGELLERLRTVTQSIGKVTGMCYGRRMRAVIGSEESLTLIIEDRSEDGRVKKREIQGNTVN
ncbi:hypothetical protein PAMP_003627 [Pampus punctatissimus]